MLRWQINTKKLEQDLVVDGLVFEVVQNFRYLGTFINLKNVIGEKIKSRTAESIDVSTLYGNYLCLEL